MEGLTTIKLIPAGVILPLPDVTKMVVLFRRPKTPTCLNDALLVLVAIHGILIHLV